MRNLYPDLAKTAQACPARPGRRWLVISLSLLTLIILSASGCQAIALEPTRIAASGEDSTPGPALPLAQEQPDRLYILSHLLRSDGTDGAVGGRITILDPTTGQASYTLETGVDIDVALSPDSSRLYVAGVIPPPDGAPGPGDDQLVALDLNTRAELWRVSLKSRIKYKGGDLATIAVSADGRWLYVYSYPWLDQGDKYEGPSNWLEIVAAETGERLPETIPLPHCGSATLVMDPAEAMLYVACYLSNEVLFVNLATRQVEHALKIPGAPFVGDDYLRIGGRPSSLIAMVMSPDGSRLYVVTDDLRIGLIEVAGRTLSQWIDHRQLDRVAVFNNSVALSADGTRLVVGERIDDEARGTTIGARLHVFDTATWDEVRQLQLDRPLSTLAIDRTGRTIYGVTTSFNGRPLPDADTLLPIRLAEPGDAAVGEPLKREGEAISRLFVAPSQLLPQPTDTPSFASGVLLQLWNAEKQYYEIRPVNPTTGEGIPGYPPLILTDSGFVESETFSADGQRLAAVGSHDRRSEGYAGGVRYWPGADELHLIDLPAWHAKTLPLPGQGWVGPLAFSPEVAYLTLVYHDALVYQGRKFSNLMLFDMGSGKLLAERTLEFRPTLLTYTPDGTTLVVYGQPLGSPPGMGKPDSPHLLLAEATTLDVMWDQPLEDIVSGDWCLEKCDEPHGAQVFAEWRPAVVPAHDGHRLYIVHADAERLTTVDLDARTIQTVEVQVARSWFEQLLALTAGVAEAKGVYTGTIKEAVLSSDGGHLYVISRTSNARHDTNGNGEEIETHLELQVIDVESGRKVASRDLEMTGTWLSGDRIGFTPDNAYLLASGWQDGERWTEVLDAKSLAHVARLEGWEIVPTRRLGGQPILLARRWPGEKQAEFEFAVLDPQSFDVVDSWLESNASWVAP